MEVLPQSESTGDLVAWVRQFNLRRAWVAVVSRRRASGAAHSVSARQAAGLSAFSVVIAVCADSVLLLRTQLRLAQAPSNPGRSAR